jgi:pterin-4a-carbinolamine dehydratase
MLQRAISGLQEVSELAYATAEHHPYWGIVYHAVEVSKITLEKWNDELTNDELSELLWRIEEIKGMLERLQR